MLQLTCFSGPFPRQCTALSEPRKRSDEKHYVSEAIRKKRHERHKANQIAMRQGRQYKRVFPARTPAKLSALMAE